MPDLNHSIDAHRENLRGWCSSPRHIAARKIQVEKHPLCSRCGRPATCVLHEYPDDYQHGYDHYVGLVERGERPTGCNTCNRMEQSGRRACPSCCENYKKRSHDQNPLHHPIRRDLPLLRAVLQSGSREGPARTREQNKAGTQSGRVYQGAPYQKGHCRRQVGHDQAIIPLFLFCTIVYF